MSKLTFETVRELIKNEAPKSLRGWIERHTAECVAEAVGELKKTHFEMGEDVQVWNDITKKWKDTTVWYNTAGCGADKPVVRRPPATRPMTYEELLVALNRNPGVEIACDTLSRPTLEVMAKDLGISTEVTE